MKMRLQKYLSLCGVSSRRAAEQLILDKQVTVNGAVAKLGSSVDPDQDVIKVGGKPVRPPDSFVYYLINKPRSVVSTTSDPLGRRTITSFVPTKIRLYPVGRLDYDSEGLMLLTNDGALTQKLTHPSYQVTKTYRVLVKGKISGSAIAQLESGVKIEGQMTAPAQVEIVESQPNNTWINITIHEGRNRQIRKMCEAIGYPVMRLIRLKLGDWELGNLKPGEYKQIQLDF